MIQQPPLEPRALGDVEIRQRRRVWTSRSQ